MTAPAPQSISSFPRGYVFQPAAISLQDADVAAYLDSVGDRNDYAGTVPPLAAVAFGLMALQAQLVLPEGSLHTAQEVEQLATVAAGAQLTLRAQIGQRSERQGYVATVIALEINANSKIAIRARATIMAPGAGES